MKIKQITLGIKSLEQALKETIQVVKNAQKGRLPKKPIRGTYFVSLEAFQRVLTPKRFELLHIIRDKQPNSLYELAQLAHRDLKNVKDDVDLLNRLDPRQPESQIGSSRTRGSRQPTMTKLTAPEYSRHLRPSC